MAQHRTKKIAFGSAIAAALFVTLWGALYAKGGPQPPTNAGAPIIHPSRMVPPIMGTVKSVDIAKSTITIVSTMDGSTVTAHLAPDVKVSGNIKVPVSDLNIGDQISVHGRPTIIAADIITTTSPGMILGSSEAPPPPWLAKADPFRRRGLAGSSAGGPSGTDETSVPKGGFGDPNAAAPKPPPDKDSVWIQKLGRVKSVKPLTVLFEGGEVATVETSPTTVVEKIGFLKPSDIKKGDPVSAFMQTQDDGSLVINDLSEMGDLMYRMGPGGQPVPHFGGPDPNYPPPLPGGSAGAGPAGS